MIVVAAAVSELWGVWNCGASPMGIDCECALLLWLRSGTYGESLWGYKPLTNNYTLAAKDPKQLIVPVSLVPVSSAPVSLVPVSLVPVPLVPISLVPFSLVPVLLVPVALVHVPLVPISLIPASLVSVPLVPGSLVPVPLVPLSLIPVLSVPIPLAHLFPFAVGPHWHPLAPAGPR